jgi:hypothetical protein
MKRINFVVVVLLLLIVVAGVVFVSRRMSADTFLIDSSRAAVVTQLQELSRFETAAFTIEKVIDAGTSSGGVRELLFGDRLLLIAHGQVIAGFDLSQMTEDDIEVEGKRVFLRLPAPQILLNSLDSQKTRVYDRQQGLLSRGERDLETAARAEAEQQIRQAACEGNILDEASKNAKRQLEGLMKALGFEEVVIEIPQGLC